MRLDDLLFINHFKYFTKSMIVATLIALLAERLKS
jgi:hypothetical protein